MITRKGRLSAVLAMLVLIFAVGCGTVAHIERDETVNFSKFRTYKWADGSLKEKNSNDLVDRRLKTIVNEEMQKNGWKRVEGNADLVLDYSIDVSKAVKQRDDPVYSRPFTRYFYNPYTGRLSGLYFPSRMLGYRNSEYPYNEGTITLHVIENRTSKLVWEGWTSNEVNGNKLTGKEIEAGVRSIMKKFNPVRSEG